MISLDVGVDAVQTVAIIALGVGLLLTTRHSDKRAAQQASMLQDAILSQHQIVKRLDKLECDVEEKCGKLDRRIVKLERPAKSA